MRACRIAVADYRARDGYLTGASDVFELPAGTTQAITMCPCASRSESRAHTRFESASSAVSA